MVVVLSYRCRGAAEGREMIGKSRSRRALAWNVELLITRPTRKSLALDDACTTATRFDLYA